MLHLLPIRLILATLAVLIAVAVLAASYMGWVGRGNAANDAVMVIRWSSALAVIAIVLLHVTWRWLTPVQSFIFPYLGGSWVGVVRFQSDEGPDQRSVRLEVKHTLLGLKLLLESEESVSSTLVVHAERNPDFERFRLYYVYLNERKEGVTSSGVRYRGLAVLRIKAGTQIALLGDYFTETNRHGTLELARAASTSWWKLWR